MHTIGKKVLLLSISQPEKICFHSYFTQETQWRILTLEYSLGERRILLFPEVLIFVLKLIKTETIEKICSKFKYIAVANEDR